MIAPQHATFAAVFGDPYMAQSPVRGPFGVIGDFNYVRNMLAPRKPERPDFGPNQLAWIEKHLGIKSLVRK